MDSDYALVTYCRALAFVKGVFGSGTHVFGSQSEDDRDEPDLADRDGVTERIASHFSVDNELSNACNLHARSAPLTKGEFPVSTPRMVRLPHCASSLFLRRLNSLRRCPGLHLRSQRQHTGGALPRFSGKRIRIFAHNDAAGQAAAQRWAEQLKDIATVDRFTFQGLEMSDGKPVKDLNELLKISGDSYRGNAKLIDGVMKFRR